MGGLSRRSFLAAVMAAAATQSVRLRSVAALAAPVELGAESFAGGSTLSQTLVRGSSRSGFASLAWGAGEPFTPRPELLGAVPNTTRAAQRRSLSYFAHMSDAHVVDAESPARFEITELGWFLGSGGMCRPQETMTAHVLDSMVRAANQLSRSPVTGAPLAFGVHTGDNADNTAAHEVRTFIDVLDGNVVTASTGKPWTYEGVQAWPECWWAYHPNPGAEDVYSRMGWPRFAGLLDAAGQPFQAEGSAVPWFAVLGNHDVTWFGSVKNTWVRDLLGRSGRKMQSAAGLAWVTLLNFLPDEQAPHGAAELWEDHGQGRRVTPDPAARRRLTSGEFVSALLDSPAAPGPVGHGFTRADLEAGRTWWAREDGPVMLLGLDTTNHYDGSEGSLIEPQFRWLEARLMEASRRYYDQRGRTCLNPAGRDRLIVVCSHHDSISLTNTIFDPGQPYRRRLADDIIALLARFPNVVVWLNGHSHHSQVTPHRAPEGQPGGFWELTTASCVDFPQQGRMVELVDNRDGTLSILSWVLDHAADADPGVGAYTPGRLASTSRLLASNDPFQRRLGSVWELRGGIEDRNVECVLPAPFELGGFGDDTLEAARVQAWARVARHREARASATTRPNR